ncbi:MAG: hypothetical protein DMF55_13250 [Acidobacteria bacterium]|nr:MAG: hypothetical protein DMF55_13250 [Acidobacteriota bacterium]
MILGFDGLRRPSLVLALAILGLLVVGPALFACPYAVRMKDGSRVLARVPYTVKGTRAIITLENGIVTQIPLEEVDVAGTEKFNRENCGNVITLSTPPQMAFRLPVRATQSVSTPSSPARQSAPALRSGPAVRGFRQLARPAARPSGSSGP